MNYSDDVLLIEHLSHRLGKLEPGDIVLVRSPVEPGKIVAKWIVAMEGDRVTFLTALHIPVRDIHNHVTADY